MEGMRREDEKEAACPNRDDLNTICGTLSWPCWSKKGQQHPSHQRAPSEVGKFSKGRQGRKSLRTHPWSVRVGGATGECVKFQPNSTSNGYRWSAGREAFASTWQMLACHTGLRRRILSLAEQSRQRDSTRL